MKIFLTGGTGFIGSHVIEAALERGHDVYALRRPGSQPRIVLERQPCWLNGTLSDDWSEALSETDVLIHLASYGVVGGGNNWEQCFKTNLQDSLDLWRRAVDCGVSRFVICGSCFEYGKSATATTYVPPNAPLWPTNAYAASKAAATMAAIALAESYELSLVVARLFHVYGPGEDPSRFYPSLMHAARNNLNFSMTSGDQIRDFIRVDEAASKLVSLAEKTEPDGDFAKKVSLINIGTGIEISIKDFAKKVWSDCKPSSELLIGDLPYRDNEVMRYVPDVASIFVQ